MNEPRPRQTSVPNVADKTSRVSLSPGLPLRQRIARGFLILSGAAFFISLFVLCFCPEFYIAMAGFAGAGIACGSRRQRTVGVTLLVLSIIIGMIGYRHQLTTTEGALRMIQRQKSSTP
jgi:hypothetical protein